MDADHLDGLLGHDRVVPAYALTGKRTRPAGRELPLEAVVTVAPDGVAQHLKPLHMESQTIVDICVRPMALAEIGAALRVPVGVARVLVGDLVNTGHLIAHLPRAGEDDGSPSAVILERLLHGLRSR
jgi:uncharacterized protein DUF742